MRDDAAIASKKFWSWNSRVPVRDKIRKPWHRRIVPEQFQPLGNPYVVGIAVGYQGPTGVNSPDGPIVSVI